MSSPSFGTAKDRRGRPCAASKKLPVHQEGNPGIPSRTLLAMKALLPALCTALALSSLSARDLAPKYWIENVTASDDSVQQSLVFRTVPGVRYRVETSENLNSWDAGDEIYGVGHDYVVPVRQFTPPPPPPPGGGGTPPPVPLRKTVSLMLKRSNGPEGGTIASWPSQAGSGSVTILLEEDLHPGWEYTPLFWDSHGGYNFFIGHYLLAAAPPASSPLLGPDDQIFRAILEARLPAMNAQVELNEIRVRNSPPPAPPVPGQKKFWRIRADWSVDTDQDGTVDWLELNPIIPAAIGEPAGDPFNADTNANGVPDGSERNSDPDQIPDSEDVAPTDGLIAWQKSDPFLFAFFNVTGTGRTIQVND